MGLVYLAENTVNGKSYVGKTTERLCNRKSVHKAYAKRGSKFPFHRAIVKYGFDAFKWRILEETDDPIELAEIEKRCILWMETKVPYGYNLTDGGDGCSGFVRSEEWKAKVSKTLMGHSVSETTRKKISIAVKKAMTPECKAKISRAVAGKKRKPCSEETKAKIGEANRRIAQSEEYKAKRSEISKQLWQSPEYRRKVTAAMKGKPGKPHTLESRARISKTLKATKRRLKNVRAIQRNQGMGQRVPPFRFPTCGRESAER